MDDTDDIWRAIKEFRRRLTALEQTSSEVHGEILDDLRNRVYALEHGGPSLAQRLADYDEPYEDDDA